jgi:arylsulfatase A-like enzyme
MIIKGIPHAEREPIALLFLAGLILVTGTGCRHTEQKKPNIVFICVDDLRPELGCYGRDYIKSPNIDRLAASGVAFTHHFVQVPTCGASRCSLLTGMLPRDRSYTGNEACRKHISSKPESSIPETFIHHLKNNGYYTVGIGKISHYPDGLLHGKNDSVTGTERELPYSWNELLFDPGRWGTGWNAFLAYADGSSREVKKRQVKPYENANVGDEGYPDGLTARLAVKKLKELKELDKPFFLGIGFFKPHLPFNAPAKYWDLYDESRIPLSPNPFIPENVNKASLQPSLELNHHYRLGDETATLERPVSDEYARRLRHGYFACVSYTDAQIGRILDELDRTGLAERTIVIIWGDHGWHLGDHLVWGKHTLFERALNSPLIIKGPHLARGAIAEAVVSSIDIYPTLIDLCGLEMPYQTDGQSLKPLLIHPEFEGWQESSYSYFNMGVTMRTTRYRLTRYFREEQPVTELYDHETDPYETRNIAMEKPGLVDSLMSLMKCTNIYRTDQ